jgi:hypothetical protein
MCLWAFQAHIKRQETMSVLLNPTKVGGRAAGLVFRTFTVRNASDRGELARSARRAGSRRAQSPWASQSSQIMASLGVRQCRQMCAPANAGQTKSRPQPRHLGPEDSSLRQFVAGPKLAPGVRRMSDRSQFAETIMNFNEFKEQTCTLGLVARSLLEVPFHCPS